MRKPQAVRQVAPELVGELGESFGRSWELLKATHGGHEADRVLARVVAAMKDHGEEAVRASVVAALGAGRTDLAALAVTLRRQVPASVPLPAALAGHAVEMPCAADHDVYLWNWS